MNPATTSFGTTVVLPTCRRPGPLVWSLVSVLRQQTAGPGPHRVVVINNDERDDPVARSVDAAASEVPNTKWSIGVIHRRPTVDPVLSWYGGIEECSREGDVVFLHGDDDLMLADSVHTRATLLVNSGATCLLSGSAAGLVFDGPDARQAILPHISCPPGQRVDPASPVTAADLSKYGAAFIGNHCYRAGPVLSETYRQVLEWLRTLPIAGRQQLAMLPYFLPIPLADRGVLVGTRVLGCVRGQTRNEIVGSRFGHVTWVPGLLYAASLHLLRKEPFSSRKDLQALREDLDELRHAWYLPTVSSRESRQGLRKLDAGPLDVWRLWRPLLRGGALVVRAFTGMQGLRFRWHLHPPKLNRARVLEVLDGRG